MGLRFPSQTTESCFFVTTSFKDKARLGDIPGVFSALAGSLSFCLQKTGARLIGYVLMPSHIHMIIMVKGPDLPDFMRDFKKYTAQKSLKDVGIKCPVWESRYDRVAISSLRVLETKLNYFHNNPVKAGMAIRPEDWQWSSACDYYTDVSGPLPVWKDWI